MNEGKTWTPEEIALLKQMRAKRIRSDLIADRLGRSRYAVYAKIGHLRNGGERMAKPGFWTDEREEALRQLWNEQKLPSNEIARLLGCGRNAVVGKAHRMKLDKRADPIIRDGRPRKRPVRKNQHEATDESVKAIIDAAAKAHGQTSVHMTKFHDCGGRAEECQWIDGEPIARDGTKGKRGVDYTFCCKPTVNKSSYCREHYNRCIKGRVRVESYADRNASA